MNVLKPVSSIMAKQLITIEPTDPLRIVKEIFAKHNIHHIPVVKSKSLVGIVSKTDFDQFLHRLPKSKDMGDLLIEGTRLDSWKVKDIMTEGLAKVDSKEPIRTALDLFRLNRFHALPVVDDGELVGMVTTFDIIDAIAGEPVKLEDYKTSKV
ncbi:MAG: CBS domain-containing protein [Saprospiraceae bacterium]